MSPADIIEGAERRFRLAQSITALATLASNIRDAAMLARAEAGAANRAIRRLLAYIEHPSTNGHRGTRYELSALVRTWWRGAWALNQPSPPVFGMCRGNELDDSREWFDADGSER